MAKENVLITEPQELIRWMSDHDVLMDISAEDIQLILNYLDGHDYAMGTDKEGNLVRIDVAMEDGECIEYSLDDFIDIVCEWNYELILEADGRRNNPKDMIDFSQAQSKYESLKKDEVLLDHMFEQTKYGKHINEFAEKIVGQVMEIFESDLEKAATVIADGVKDFHMERKR